MEEITLIGNLGNDPDVRYTNGGEKVVSFSLAVQAGKKAQGEALAHWYTCDAWERLADMKEQMESVCQKNYEACAIYRMVMAEKYGGDEACRA